MTHEEQQAGSGKRRARIGPRAKAAVLMIVSTLVTFAVGEGVVRLMSGDRIVLFPRFHSKAIYGDYTLRRLRPNTEFWHRSVDGRWKFVTNAQGFRNASDFPYSKPPGRLRALAIGDSHTEGFEVRQEFTYAAVVERWLRTRDVESEVINAGISGFGTAEAVAFLEQEGVKYDPDVVIYGFFANDYEDNVRSGLFGLADDTLVATSKVYAPAVAILDAINKIPPIRWLSENSYLYSLAFNSLWVRFKTLGLRRARRDLTLEHAKPMAAAGDYESRLMAALVRRLGKFCRERGILLVIVDIPDSDGSGIGGFKSSMPPPLRPVAEESADILLFSDDVVGPFRGGAELHTPHGFQHLSEFGHAVYGVRVGEAIRTAQHACRGPGDRLHLCRLRAQPETGTR